MQIIVPKTMSELEQEIQRQLVLARQKSGQKGETQVELLLRFQDECERRKKELLKLLGLENLS